ncbi:hypothetical protein PAL_GLEAN10012210 [Pteropus alecto]|uniref:Uncharacterized protein n=1 Tax=Pteropus alecto TaxID=9402 RepID=L5KDU4_PTEAL|nr:hypothetical protein PAL_GLEAN10012210 [Pteropus alecto]
MGIDEISQERVYNEKQNEPGQNPKKYRRLRGEQEEMPEKRKECCIDGDDSEVRECRVPISKDPRKTSKEEAPKMGVGHPLAVAASNSIRVTSHGASPLR